MCAARLTLSISESCYTKLNTELAERFFIPCVYSSGFSEMKDADVYALYGENMLERATELSQATAATVVLLTDNADARLLNVCTMRGIICCAIADFSKHITDIYAMRIRLKSMDKSRESLKRKLDDSKLVNRAKLLLMTRLRMTETQAHRYIEKTAMDSCCSMREVSLSIIKTYED